MNPENRKYHFVYRTECLITNKFYIGVHSTDNLEDGYLGSGKILKASLRKHGVENHKRQILEFCNSRILLKQREEFFVSEEVIKQALCMNLIVGGYLSNGNFEKFNSNSELQREKGKKGMDARRQLKETNSVWVNKVRRNKSASLKKQYAAGTRKITIQPYSAPHSVEMKQQLSLLAKERIKNKGNPMTVRCWIFNKETKTSLLIFKKDLELHLNLGWIKGKGSKRNKG